MESRPLNYRSGAQYAAYQTDPTSLSSPYTSLYEWQAPAWPLYPSTASTDSHPPFSLLASSSADTSSASSLAATFGGYQYPYYASNFSNNDLFASTVLHRPHQTPHIVEAPLATVAPQLTWRTAPTYTPTYSPPVLPQQNRTPPSRLTKRHREEAEDPEKGRGLKAASGKKRRTVSANSRSHNPLADIAEPQSSQHAAPPPRVGHAARTRQPKERSTRPSSQSDENIPILDESRDSYGYVQDGRAELRSRSRALAVAGSPSILNVVERMDVPSWVNPPIGVEAPAPSPPGEHTWCTPAFYEELRNIASALVARNQASTSGASDGVVPIDEGPPVPSSSGASRAKRRRASVEKTPVDWLQVAPEDDGQSAEGSTNSTAGVAQGKFLCPFADYSGVCDEPETQKRCKKRRKVAVSASDNGASHGPKLSVFTRLTDLERHVLSRHLKVYVHCRRCYEANKPSKFVRYDGFQRHFRSTCSKGTKSPQPDPKAFAFILMPCYRDPDGLFVKALSGFPKARTAFLLEGYLRKKFTEDIRRCECCAKLDDEEMDAIKAPISAMGDPGVQLRTVSASASEGLEEDRFPPEEEEGVDEKPVSEAGHASNLDVGSLVASASYLSELRSTAQENRTIDFSDQGEQASQGSLGHRKGVSADDDRTIPESDLDNAFYKSLESLDQLLAQPWTDFGLEVGEPDATWMVSS